jgi:tetratricopeptide (TPR) repeat protein
VSGPRNEAEQEASKLADRASQEARRGDYQAAMKTLDEAEKIAPRYALIQQYRSNVAFLMGDTARAKQALQKALEIEPDNALFKTNLKRLEQAAAK